MREDRERESPRLPRPRALLACWVVLFLAYQLPGGLSLIGIGSPIVQGLLMLAVLPLAWAIGRSLGFPGLRAFALERSPRWAGWLLFGLATALLVKAAAVVLGLRLAIYASAGAPAPQQGVGGWVIFFCGSALYTFVPSLAEDLLTRGYLYRAAALGERLSGSSFVLLSSALYVVNHVYRLALGPLEWGMLFFFGLAYAVALWRSGTLWAAVGLHWGWNLANALLEGIHPYVIVHAQAGRILSAAAHLVLLAAVLLRRRAADPAG